MISPIHPPTHSQAHLKNVLTACVSRRKTFMIRSGGHFQHRYGASHLKAHLQKDGVFKERYVSFVFAVKLITQENNCGRPLSRIHLRNLQKYVCGKASQIFVHIYFPIFEFPEKNLIISKFIFKKLSAMGKLKAIY